VKLCCYQSAGPGRWEQREGCNLGVDRKEDRKWLDFSQRFGFSPNMKDETMH